jgi:hypothetical protein
MSTLYEQTLELLIASDLTLTEIAINADVPYDWLVSIRYDRVKNPSVNRVQQLYEFLSGKPLTV